MPLPPKELYTIAEVASRWNIPKNTVEEYLLTGKLQSSVFLPRRMMCKYSIQMKTNHKVVHDDDPYIYDIDENDPDSYRTRNGLFNLLYQDIDWNEQGQAEMEEGGAYLTLPDEEGFFGFDDNYILKRDDVLITLSELHRFEAEYGITAHDLAEETSCREKLPKAYPVSDPKLHPKEKESLLKMVISMAMDGYGFNPADKKSPIPGEIAANVEKFGLSIDADTVRKWLKEAVGLLPGDALTD